MCVRPTIVCSAKVISWSHSMISFRQVPFAQIDMDSDGTSVRELHLSDTQSKTGCASHTPHLPPAMLIITIVVLHRGAALVFRQLG